MSAIAASIRFAEKHSPDTSGAPIHDVTDCIESWGRRGIFFGANFGFVLGAIFVAIPYTSNALAFGAIGTLVVGMVECAFIAGAFAALAAALYGNGVRGVRTVQFEHILQAGRRSAVSFPRDVPLVDWPSRWAYPVQASRPSPLQIRDSGRSTAFSSLDTQARFSLIDVWENGSTGP